ncbi:ATP-binding cassette domain-containing protein [Romboutsia weinsteinii]|uniref:ABC-type quaternary amine transporter n=1 Tax=Romboutsia weinsteinii TaxID=2020949 RepID=A0A371J8T3_9FIRM|nr:ABC transporter ATP-binding protein [Romboutsia weinsteinii]RDY29144.1 ATP-binding cassette domain-containing protein [Romboutsia weinsteinii]
MLKINNLYFKYKNSKEDNIKDFNLEIEKGEIVSILGESGSGKSTMLRIIAGLEDAYKGKITISESVVYDENISIEPEKRGIGMVFQDYALFPHMNVSKNIMFGLKKMDKTQREKKMLEMLRLVNLEEYKDKYPHELSGGQQQRIAIARAIAPSPSILLLDEPFSNLDANLQSKIRTELKEIIQKANITSIFVTHDKEDAKALADKVVVLEKGEIIKVGDIEDII